MLEYFSTIIENPSVEQEWGSTEILFLKNRASQDVLFSPRWAKRLTWSWTRCSRLWSESRWSTCSVGDTIASKNIYWQEAAGQTTEIFPSFDPQLCLPGHLSHLLTSRIVRTAQCAWWKQHQKLNKYQISRQQPMQRMSPSKSNHYHFSHDQIIITFMNSIISTVRCSILYTLYPARRYPTQSTYICLW